MSGTQVKTAEVTDAYAAVTGRAHARPVPLLSGRKLRARYGGDARRWWGGRARTGDDVDWALNGVNIEIYPGEVFGIVGESGSGKTTLANCLTGLMAMTSGEVDFAGQTLPLRSGRVRPPRIRGIQMAYQDPSSTLNPRRTIGSTLGEILRVHKLVARSDVRQRCVQLLAQVGLDADVLSSRPAELSGGMCQRVAIARALAFEPKVLVADEIVSALDASVQAQVLNLILDLRESTGIAVAFVTHDLAVVSQVCDRVMVMSSGRVVESGEVRQVLDSPAHDYTRQLVAASPDLIRNPP